MLIATGSYGLYGYTFSDFGSEFVCRDKNGENPRSGMVVDISNDGEGVVTCSDDEMHGLETGDMVVFVVSVRLSHFCIYALVSYLCIFTHSPLCFLTSTIFMLGCILVVCLLIFVLRVQGVEGMEELNDGIPREVTVLSRYAFSVTGTAEYGQYIRGGYFTGMFSHN